MAEIIEFIFTISTVSIILGIVVYMIDWIFN